MLIYVEEFSLEDLKHQHYSLVTLAHMVSVVSTEMCLAEAYERRNALIYHRAAFCPLIQRRGMTLVAFILTLFVSKGKLLFPPCNDPLSPRGNWAPTVESRWRDKTSLLRLYHPSWLRTDHNSTDGYWRYCIGTEYHGEKCTSQGLRKACLSRAYPRPPWPGNPSICYSSSCFLYSTTT